MLVGSITSVDAVSDDTRFDGDTKLAFAALWLQLRPELTCSSFLEDVLEGVVGGVKALEAGEVHGGAADALHDEL